jgi:hypothetical protein
MRKKVLPEKLLVLSQRQKDMTKINVSKRPFGRIILGEEAPEFVEKLVPLTFAPPWCEQNEKKVRLGDNPKENCLENTEAIQFAEIMIATSEPHIYFKPRHTRALFQWSDFIVLLV